MTVLAAIQRCFAANPAKVHASSPLQDEHVAALQAAESLLVANADKQITELYTLGAPVGHGAFAKVVKCTHKVRFACATDTLFVLLRHLTVVLSL